MVHCVCVLLQTSSSMFLPKISKIEYYLTIINIKRVTFILRHSVNSQLTLPLLVAVQSLVDEHMVQTELLGEFHETVKGALHETKKLRTQTLFIRHCYTVQTAKQANLLLFTTTPLICTVAHNNCGLLIKCGLTLVRAQHSTQRT